MKTDFKSRLKILTEENRKLLTGKMKELNQGTGSFTDINIRYLPGTHAPLFWRYDLDPETNPHLMERFGIHAAFNAGAMKFNGKYILAVRVEGNDRKSFFAIAESPNGVDNFRFWDYP